jgi:hypothetical protein
VSADEHLPLALSDWQRKHNIADSDPMIAVLDLVRLAIQYPPKPEAATTALPPTFEEFRATMELLDTRSKAFVSQSTTLIGELRTFTQTIQRLNESHAATFVMMLMLGLASGLGVGWFIWS